MGKNPKEVLCMKKKIIASLLVMVFMLGVAIVPAHALDATEGTGTQCERYTPIAPHGRGQVITD